MSLLSVPKANFVTLVATRFEGQIADRFGRELVARYTRLGCLDASRKDLRTLKKLPCGRERERERDARDKTKN